MNVSGEKAQWYNHFYSQKKIEKTYPWYKGLMKFLDSSPITSEMKILEIGCGAGEFLKTFRNDIHCIGIDISKTALKIAHSSSVDKKRLYLQSQAEALPFKNDIFDIIICCEVIEHVNNMEFTLNEMHRVLKENGKEFISFPNYYNPFYFFIRLLSQILHQPQWISLQIVDRYLFYNKVVSLFSKLGFCLQSSKGTCYFHTKIPLLKYFNYFENIFDNLKLQFLSFHPVLFFKKK